MEMESMQASGDTRASKISKFPLILVVVLVLVGTVFLFKIKNLNQVSAPIVSDTGTPLFLQKGSSFLFPKGVILEENETLVYTSGFTTPLGQKSVSAAYTTDKEISDVVKMYSESLPKTGWTIVSQTENPKPKSTVLTAKKETQSLTVAILMLDENKTVLSFNYSQ